MNLGMTRSDWNERFRDVERFLGTAKERTAGEPAPAPPPASTGMPGWLRLPELASASRRLIDLAPSPVGGKAVDRDEAMVALQQAFAATIRGEWKEAAGLVKPVTGALGTSWGPTDTIDGLRFFAWLRAIECVERIQEPDPPDHVLLSARWSSCSGSMTRSSRTSWRS